MLYRNEELKIIYPITEKILKIGASILVLSGSLLSARHLITILLVSSEVFSPWVLLEDGLLISVGVLGSLSFLNWNPDLVFTREGIIVKIFMVLKVTIPWNSVIRIRESFPSLKRSRFIEVEELTVLHRLYGLYCLTTNPCIPVASNRGEYREVKRMIEDYTK